MDCLAFPKKKWSKPHHGEYEFLRTEVLIWIRMEKLLTYLHFIVIHHSVSFPPPNRRFCQSTRQISFVFVRVLDKIFSLTNATNDNILNDPIYLYSLPNFDE